jgi:hypothetical protein
LVPFIIVDLIEFLLENHFDNHDTQSKYVSFFEINPWILVILGEGNHELWGQVYSFGIIFIENLKVRPVSLFFSDDSPSGIVGYSSVSDTNISSLDSHLRNTLDDRQKVVIILWRNMLQ